MTQNEPPPDTKAPSEIDVIKIGILQVPRDQVFPIVLVFALLVSGVAVVVASTDAFRLAGLIAIVVGLGWAALIYQNAQNKRKHDANDAAKVYDITITVLSENSQPVNGARVTVLGPVPFTNRPTNKDGRVPYKYTGRDADNFRNRNVTISATHEGITTTIEDQLRSQTGQYITLKLKPPAGPTSTPALSNPAVTHANEGESPIMSMNAALFRRIVDFLTPHVADEASRSALINRAFFGTPVIGKIDTSGNAADFAAHIITRLHTIGGVELIVTLLMALRDDLGLNKQQEIDALVRELRA